MSAADKSKLDEVAANANNYIHPTSSAGAKSSGLYKIATDANGHVTGATAVTKTDITNLGIPAQDTNTTYSVVTTSKAGLLSSTDKRKLELISYDGFIIGGQKENVTIGNWATAEGSYQQATRDFAHAEGYSNIASAIYCHAQGQSTVASGACSHSSGGYTTASGLGSHALCGYTKTSGEFSIAAGLYTTASNYASAAFGRNNKAMTNGAGSGTYVGDVFVIGNGTGRTGYADKLSNAFRVTYGGEVYGTQAFKSSGADYAEFIYEWEDGNLENQDRVGYFVTIKNQKLCFAQEGDYIAGVTSGNPSVVGNADEDYYWRYERDEFNRIIWEDCEEFLIKTDENGGMLIHEETNMPAMVKSGKVIKNGQMKLNPNYDSNKQNDYIERKDRPEWDYVGMLGVLPVRDDGTCEVDGFCKCNNGAIATKADTWSFNTYRVIERISDNIIRIILK